MKDSVAASKHNHEPWFVNIILNGHQVPMEIDTGSAKTVIGEEVFNQIQTGDKEISLVPSETVLSTYSGETISPIGKAEVPVKYGNKEFNLFVEVTKCKTHPLIGRNWLSIIKLDWHKLLKVSESSVQSVQDLCKEFPKLFQEGLGTVSGVKAKIHVDDGARPIYCKARPVPYLLKDQIDLELNRLVKEGTLEPVDFSEWAAPIVPIVKEDKTIRICGDYKVTVNKVSKLDNYPIPKSEDLFVTLNGGKQFSKLDISQAYQQVLLEDSSKQYTTINTHKGLFQYTHLPYHLLLEYTKGLWKIYFREFLM